MASDLVVRRVATTVSLGLAVVVAATAATIFWPRLAVAMGMAPSGPAAPPAAYSAGDTIDVPADWYAGADRTVILVAQAACGACQRATPYLRGLVEQFGDRATFLMASPGRESAYDRQYGRDLGLSDDAIRVLPRGARAQVTPTLVVVDRQGTVLGAWEGVGPVEQHAALTRAVSSAIRRRSGLD